jgi:hypothetical protein
LTITLLGGSDGIGLPESAYTSISSAATLSAFVMISRYRWDASLPSK